MAVGKLLTVGTLISSCAVLQSKQPYYGDETRLSYQRDAHPIITVARLMSRSTGANSVPKQDRDRHQKCVFFALERLNLGEECKWYSNKTSASGAVKVVHVYPSGSNMCHVFFSTLSMHNRTKRWQDTGCYSRINDRWHFIAKR